ncbi:MAG: hypothetical protein AAGD38_13215 [Acidobacteriota bacterium]
MGVFYDSVSLPGDQRRAVLTALERWLAHRGFELHDGPALFDLDPVWDRGVFLRTNGKWTVVCYSEHEEQKRVLHELGTLEAPLLSLWLWDSEVWGWDVLDGGRFAGTFSSDPDFYVSHPDISIGRQNRPHGTAETLASRFGLDATTGAAIGRLGNLADNEQAFAELCRLLDLEGANAGYGELEHGTVPEPDGWRTEHLVFVHRTAVDPLEVDLHQARITRWSPGPGGTIEAVTGTVEIQPAVLQELERTRRKRWLMLSLLKPIGAVARAGKQCQEWLGRIFTSGGRGGAMSTGFRIEGRKLINDRHGCRIEIPAEAEPVVVSARPASVFAFRLGGVEVTCTARRLSKVEEILRRPGGSKVERDDKTETVDGLPTRHVVIRLAERGGGGRLVLDVVQTPRAFYVFVCRVPSEIDPAVYDAVRETVTGFRLS